MIVPFRGLRYSPNAGELAHLVTQPYDKISEELRQTYQSRSPWNVVRLIRGERSPDDAEWYASAAALLDDMRRSGIMRHDDEASFYAYRQTFIDPRGQRHTRRGLVGAFDLQHRDRVLHHERTHAGPRADRRRLLEATGVHFGQIFLLRHRGPSLPDRVWDGGEEIGRVTDDDGVEHVLSRITDSAILADVAAAHSNSRYVIADGHHRFTVACSHADAHPDAPAAGFCMVCVVDVDDPGLVVLPTHRVLSDLPSERTNGLAPLLQRIGGRPVPVAAGDESAFVEALAAAGAGTIGAIVRGGAYLLPLESSGEGVDRLDVARLESTLLRPLLQGLEIEEHLSYRRDPIAAFNDVRGGRADAAFLLNPIAPEEVATIAEAGGVMPPKSTDFYPKMLTGLVAYDTSIGPPDPIS